MKTYGRMAFFFYCVTLFFLYTIVFTVPVSNGEPAEEEGIWWPFMEADPPELVAFSMALEKARSVPGVFPHIEFDQNTKVNLLPEVVVKKQGGKPVGVGIAVEVTKRLEGKYVFRRFIYHHVWTADMLRVFRDVSFLNRTLEENKALAFGDASAYWERVEAAVNNVDLETVQDALRTCGRFNKRIADGLPVSEPAHVGLQEFASQVDHVFSQAYEPFLGFSEFTPEQFTLVFDYEPWSQNQFVLKAAAALQVATPFGTSFTYEKEQHIANVNSDSADPRNLPANLAKQAFRVLSQMWIGEK